MNLLESIHSHQDLVALTPEQRVILCQQLREFLIANVSQTGGHVASNLGIVELTVAIETVTRRKIDPKYEGYIHAAGMLLLLGLMGYVMLNDIFKIVSG